MAPILVGEKPLQVEAEWCIGRAGGVKARNACNLDR
jgi:hypothetical protein